MNIDLSSITTSGILSLTDAAKTEPQAPSSSSLSVLDAWLRERSEDLLAQMFPLDQSLGSFA
jgi:hypothetical protein